MTTHLKVLGQASPAAVVEASLYTVPAGKEAVISSLAVCNTNSTNVTYRVIVAVGGEAPTTADMYLAYDETLAANQTYVFSLGISLAQDDEIRVYASATGVSFQAFGQENVADEDAVLEAIATATDLRNSLNLGNLSALNSPLLIADGGTGATTAAGAITNLEIEIAQFITFSRAGTLVTGTGTMRWRAPIALTIKHVRLACGTAPTGAAILVDVHKGGTTIYTTQGNRPTIAISAFAETSTTAPDVTAVAAGDYLTVDIDQIGSTIAGADLTIVIYAVVS